MEENWRREERRIIKREREGGGRGRGEKRKKGRNMEVYITKIKGKSLEKYIKGEI